jgi:spoIIIJ-associated protein
VAHAEASARTIEAAVTTAAAQLGLRADQVDVEILEEPVPSTFGYIGSPARVRVTPRAGSGPGDAEVAGDRGRSAVEGAEGAAVAAEGSGPVAGSRPVSTAGGTAEPVSTARGDAESVSDAGRPSEPVSAAAAAGLASAPALATGSESTLDPTSGEARPSPAGSDRASPAGADGVPSVGADAVPSVGAEPIPSAGADRASPADASRPPSAGATEVPAPVSDSGPTPATGSRPTSGPPPDPAPTEGQPVLLRPNRPDQSSPSDHSNSAEGSSTPGAETEAATNVATEEPASAAGAQAPGVDTSQGAQPSSTTATGRNGDRDTDRSSAASPSPDSTFSTAPAPKSASPGAPRSPRRTYRDEPFDPAVVEADTERAGDFLEGLLDMLDVDGDITTWVDEVGGHIDLEGSDLDALVGSNGETLDALQELTRLAVLRQSKRRVRLLLDINGFRARQRERLVSMVKATAEQVIRTREDHEFQPMTPAERKIVHDAVATIDGARTESLGEDPHRRVVIRPA